jgi:hypothetical protein
VDRPQAGGYNVYEIALVITRAQSENTFSQKKFGPELVETHVTPEPRACGAKAERLVFLPDSGSDHRRLSTSACSSGRSCSRLSCAASVLAFSRFAVAPKMAACVLGKFAIERVLHIANQAKQIRLAPKALCKL